MAIISSELTAILDIIVLTYYLTDRLTSSVTHSSRNTPKMNDLKLVELMINFDLSILQNVKKNNQVLGS